MEDLSNGINYSEMQVTGLRIKLNTPKPSWQSKVHVQLLNIKRNG